MIASLHGKLESLGSDWIIINVSGIGFQVFMPTSTLSTMGRPGDDISLHTHFHLREDNATLFGFATADELRLFQTLIGVSGLGPRLALAMLSTMSVEQLVMAIATGSTELLSRIPGIGKKMADRLIVELRGKLGADWITAPAIPISGDDTEVLAALTSLGYSVAEASKVQPARRNVDKRSIQLILSPPVDGLPRAGTLIAALPMCPHPL